MYIGNDLIESIPLELSNISRPGYIGTFKRNLKIKYSDLIRQFSQAPEFLIAVSQPQNQQAGSDTYQRNP